jgi:formylglycine-generating enzyme required for sulfatase activity
VIDPKGPKRGMTRVIRGGAFDLPSVDCRSAARGHADPSMRSASVGFRIVVQDDDATTTRAAVAPASRPAD